MIIPGTLCDGARLLIPPKLVQAYLDSLKAHGLFAAASETRPSLAPIGGLSKEATDLHYAHAFDGSVARAQLAVLDPKGEVRATASKLIQFLSGGSLTFVDVPAGAGAGALAILCTIAELRKCGVLPRQPLNVHLIWGEISSPARHYAHDLIARVQPELIEQAIFITWDCSAWDVLCEVSNSELVEKIVLSKSKNLQTLLLVSNFNGFLEKENKKKSAYPQIAELIKYSSGKMNAAVWIEPNMNTAKIGLFPYIMAKLTKLAGFARATLDGVGNESTEFKFSIPIRPDDTVAVRLCVMPIDLERAAI